MCSSFMVDWFLLNLCKADRQSLARRPAVISVLWCSRICPRHPRMAGRICPAGKSFRCLSAAQVLIGRYPAPPSLWPGRELRKSHCLCDRSSLYREDSSPLTDRHPARTFRPSWRLPLMWLLITRSYLNECALFSCHGASPSGVVTASPLRLSV